MGRGFVRFWKKAGGRGKGRLRAGGQVDGPGLRTFLEEAGSRGKGRLRAARRPVPTESANPFGDVKMGEYYYSAVLWAKEKNITTGKTATTFAPNATCTRGQIVTFLWRFSGLSG